MRSGFICIRNRWLNIPFVFIRLDRVIIPWRNWSSHEKLLLPDNPTSLLDKMIPARKLCLVLFSTALCVKGLDAGGYPFEWLLRCSTFNTKEYDPLCGTDGKTYGNGSKLRIHNCLTGQMVTVKHRGRCRELVRCSTFNTKEYDPFCGTDGIVLH